MKAYSPLCYIRVITKNRIFAILLCEKAKIALKKISIPRLELLSCVLLAKLLKNVKNGINKIFEITNIFIGVILKLVYTGPGALKRSGKNRVNADYKSWYYASTKVNLADLTSRNSRQKQ